MGSLLVWYGLIASVCLYAPSQPQHSQAASSSMSTTAINAMCALRTVPAHTPLTSSSFLAQYSKRDRPGAAAFPGIATLNGSVMVRNLGIFFFPLHHPLPTVSLAPLPCVAARYSLGFLYPLFPFRGGFPISPFFLAIGSGSCILRCARCKHCTSTHHHPLIPTYTQPRRSIVKQVGTHGPARLIQLSPQVLIGVYCAPRTFLSLLSTQWRSTSISSGLPYS